MASHRAAGSVAPEEAPPAGLPRFRGHHDAYTPSQPPRRPPTPTWIYPKPIDPDTSCRSPMPPASWIPFTGSCWPETSPSDDSFRNPRRISSPGPPRSEDRGAPCRAAPCNRSRKRLPVAAPKVPSTPKTSLSPDRNVAVAAEPGRARGCPHDRPRDRPALPTAVIPRLVRPVPTPL
jgi:hypothetical protein